MIDKDNIYGRSKYEGEACVLFIADGYNYWQEYGNGVYLNRLMCMGCGEEFPYWDTECPRYCPSCGRYFDTLDG